MGIRIDQRQIFEVKWAIIYLTGLLLFSMLFIKSLSAWLSVKKRGVPMTYAQALLLIMKAVNPSLVADAYTALARMGQKPVSLKRLIDQAVLNRDFDSALKAVCCAHSHGQYLDFFKAAVFAATDPGFIHKLERHLSQNTIIVPSKMTDEKTALHVCYKGTMDSFFAAIDKKNIEDSIRHFLSENSVPVPEFDIPRKLKNHLRAAYPGLEIIDVETVRS